MHEHINSQSNIIKLVLMVSSCTKDEFRVDVTYTKSHSQREAHPRKTGMMLRNSPMLSHVIHSKNPMPLMFAN